jgi:hypothetical protein
MRRDRLIRQALRHRFVATLDSGESFEGLLYEVDELTYHFVDAFALGATRVRVDGALFLPRVRVSYLQKPGEVKG